jgi:hypothetical protein
MGNICDIFSFNKECNNECNSEYNKECFKEYNNDKKNNTNHVPFLDISNIYYDEHAEPPSYSQLRNVKNDEHNKYNNFFSQCD